jgi:excisionase family DNA binding protein
MAHLIKPWIVRYVDAEGRRVGKDTPGAIQIRERAKKWYGQGVPGWPKDKRVPIATHKATAQAYLNRMVQEALRGQAGLTDQYREHNARPLAEHLTDYRRLLEAKDDSPTHVRKTCRLLETIFEACRWKTLSHVNTGELLNFLTDLRSDRTPAPIPDGQEQFTPAEAAALLGVTREAVYKAVKKHRLPSGAGKGKAKRLPRETVEALAKRAARGHGTQAANYYLRALQRFCRWCVRDRRIPESPVAYLEGGNPKLDRRHDRRELPPADLIRLFEHTQASPSAFRGLTGIDRYHLYLAACGTGFRAGELAALVPELFDFGSEPATVTLPAATDKRRRRAVQPLPPAVAAALRDYLRGKPAGRPVWPGTWAERAADMLAADLEAVGVPYVVQGPDGPLYADFHALRHTYVSTLARSGLTVKQAQKLARHSTPELTIGRYAHAELAELGEAVGRLPALTAPGSTAEPIVGVPEKQLDALTTLAGLALVLFNGLTTTGGSLVAPMVAPNFAPPGDGSGRIGTNVQDNGQKAG